jgi:uncharacterized membrane protein YdjX (TVP38/TMEM64 family)
VIGNSQGQPYCLDPIISNFTSKKPNLVYAIAGWTALLFAVGIVGWSWFSHGIAWTLLRTNIEPSIKLEAVKYFFDSFGNLAPGVYVACVMIEVLVAPIPGLMLYAPGGIIFGGFKGGLLSLVGNTLGAGISCAAVRGIGDAWMRRFFSAEKIEATQDLIERRGAWLILLLRANPLTSSDLVSYAAGLTHIPIWKVMTATAFGMAPLCFAQAYLADNLMRRYPWLFYPLLAFCGIYLIVILLVIYRIRTKPKPPTSL